MKTFPAVEFTDLALEREVLALLLADPTGEALRDSRIMRSDFSAPHHGQLFGVLSEMVLDGKRIDPLLVAEELKQRQLLEAYEGMSGLWSLIDEVQGESAAYLAGVSDKVKLLAYKRALRAAAVGFHCAIDTSDAPEALASNLILDLTRLFARENGLAWQTLAAVAQETMEEIDAAFQHTETTDLRVGLTHLDRRFDVLCRGDLMILAARPSMGKTALALLIAQTNALRGKKVGIVSLEMSPPALVKRFMAMQNAKLTLQHLTRGDLTADAWQEVVSVASEVSAMPIWVADESTLTIQDLCRLVTTLHRTHGLDVLVLDYLQLLTSSNPKDNRNAALSEMTRELKLLAHKLKICVVCLSQLSRECERRTDKRPMLSDLRDSGAIEQDADVVAMLYRAAVYEEEADPGTAEIFIRKNRNGPVGDQDVRWNAPQTLFGDMY